MSNHLNHYYLQEMGIEPWILREGHTGCDKQLKQLMTTVASCRRCSLADTRTNTVFSRGNPGAKLMIIGEAPGFYEDKQGKPFVGKAGLLLDRMLKSIGLDEQQVYIANVLKCRPPDNRDPMADEIEQCRDYLVKQIELVSPALLLALGRFAGQFLMGKTTPLNQMRAKLHSYQAIPFLVTYHPAYLLRNPKDKKHAFSDLLLVKQRLSSGDEQQATGLQSC
ncbi:uracil-DNA glycosylase [Legionella taurinensis]|uniref:Type-4 uracil-DNA glycosylase n=1 Tax=Legionella taurinensis TaxID=70611 RepID=A0A3A5L2M5_9GAMM|nr:uracil-DNA glycosylase [Legionella taurinensis]MDX1838254.1 uracil-DNA glycosylase [Legionella taurinensis]PUT39254.1 uracil-DNA glycosylase [Legionella taurinensis]PUT40600.1 uracil-DNA glycosylase [Legionella taurinensis]PUT44020.1 uracil-DNA glycosylase [Legionella taurinensis]PUT46282.1 uracil-DNA glycosylase [Legionella taurinensis]